MINIKDAARSKHKQSLKHKRKLTPSAQAKVNAAVLFFLSISSSSATFSPHIKQYIQNFLIYFSLEKRKTKNRPKNISITK